MFIKPPRKHLARDSTIFYYFPFSALCNLFLVVEISMARTVYLNESQSNVPSASCSSVLSSEEGNNQLWLHSSLHFYQYYFRHIRIKEPPEFPPAHEKNDSAKIQFPFFCTINICFRLGWKRPNYFLSSSLVSKTLPWNENGSGPGRSDGKEQTSYPLSSYSLIY